MNRSHPLQVNTKSQISPDNRPPQIRAVKLWRWAGWYAWWEWRYLLAGRSRPCTRATVIRRYAHRLGYAAVCRLLDAAQAAYQEPGGVPAGILAGAAVLVPSAAAPRTRKGGR